MSSPSPPILAQVPSAASTSGSPALTYDVVIATRNRPQALALSIPLILGQSRPPQKILVMDSSDRPQEVAAALDLLRAGQAARGGAAAQVPLILCTTPRGSSRQRNLGLDQVTAPVVLFPDDDSLLHPGAAAAILAVYERDTAGRIAAVCAADAAEPPEGVLEGASYRMTGTHQRHARLVRLRNALETWVTDLNPFLEFGRLRMDRLAGIDWLEEMNCVPVEYMTGYRMSFRTAAIRAVTFEEIFEGYGLYEDIDASFAATRFGGLVGARNARIYHHRYPGGRPDPHALAAMAVLNRAFVLAKNARGLGLDAAQTARIRAKFRAYGRARLAMQLPFVFGSAGRDAFRGTRAALRESPRILEATPQTLAAAYLAAKTAIGLDPAT